ncbi:MAG: retroviral-like aspartic protease family protein [Planctomycetes bacterium]|nr:retroviral-like aspartic protease family protein [Planctomycetota bacterium]
MLRSRRSPPWPAQAIGAFLSLQAVFCALPGAAAAPSPAEEVLQREFGLSRRTRGEVWITPRESELRRRLSHLPKVVDHARKVGEAVVDARERNRLLWAQRQALEETFRKKIKELSPSDPQRKQMEQSLKKMDSLAVPPEKLGGAPWVQPHLIDMTNSRHAILLGAYAAREDAMALAGEYEALRQNHEVAEALSQLAGEHRLGPLKDYSSDLRRLKEYEEFVYAQPQPLYLQSGKVRLGGILNEAAPVTFTWRDSSEPTVITASIAQASGLAPPADAPVVSLTFDGRRRLSTRRILLASIRFGPHVLRDVEAHILPPEGEDLGAQISRAAFTGFQVAADPAHLRFRIEPAE